MDGPVFSRDAVASRLSRAGCVAPHEEADELIAAADSRLVRLEELVARREAGEPLAWVVGSTVFAGHRVRVDPGVYVPRWQSEPLARRALELLPDDGLAVDLCTGSGAIAHALAMGKPGARIVATDIDPAACRCAIANGVEVFCGDLAEPLPEALTGRCDVVIGVVPYVPTDRIEYLPRDVRLYEPLMALDGGTGGTRVLEAAVLAGSRLLGAGGWLLLELGGDQDRALAASLRRGGFVDPVVHRDEDGDVRGIETRRL